MKLRRLPEGRSAEHGHLRDFSVNDEADVTANLHIGQHFAAASVAYLADIAFDPSQGSRCLFPNLDSGDSLNGTDYLGGNRHETSFRLV